MSIDAAISAIDQIVELPELLMDPTGASTSAASTSAASSSLGTTATTGAAGLDSATSTSPTSSASDTEFANALAAASGNTLASSALGSSDLDTGDDSAASSSSPSLGESDDSALLSLMSSLGSTSSASASAADPTTMATDMLGGAATPATTTPAATTPVTTMPATTDVENAIATPSGAATQAAQATGPEDPRIEAMQQQANSLVGKPYVYGGGHDSWAPQSGYDCSGFVSAVLHAGGYLSTPQDTTSLPNAAGMESGPGQYVTVYDRSQPGQDGHVIIDIDGQFYESGGESGSWGGGGGVEKISTPSASYLSTFNDVLHPAGL